MGISRLSTARHRTLALAVAAVVGGAMLTLPTANPASADLRSDCPDVLVIAARGSGEAPQGAGAISRTNWNSGSGAGTTLRSFSHEVSLHMPQGRRLSVVGVNYPAHPLKVLTGDLISSQRRAYGPYMLSIKVGIADAKKRLTAVPAKCTGITNIVLAGYSSGAMVVHGLLKELSPASRSKIAAIVTFGNPYFDNKEKWASLSFAHNKRVQGIAFSRGRNGSAFGFNASGVPADVTKRTMSYCMNRDPVCASMFGGKVTPYTLGALAACAIGCAHYKYGRNSGFSLLHVLNHLKYSNVHSLILQVNNLPVGTAGQPYSATLSASGGITPYRFAVVSGKPAWLNLNTVTGLMSGTPTQPENRIVIFSVTDARGRSCTSAITLRIGSSPSASASPSASPSPSPSLSVSPSASPSPSPSPSASPSVSPSASPSPSVSPQGPGKVLSVITRASRSLGWGGG